MLLSGYDHKCFRGYFDSLCRNNGLISCDIFSEVDEITFVRERYKEPWRHYHGTEHIIDGFSKFVKILPSISSRDRKIELMRAWIYHDIFYAPNFPLNEFYSAELSLRMSPRSLSGLSARVIYQHILGTEDHLVPDGAIEPEDMALIIDIDLSRLAGSPEEFVTDTDLIYLEYKDLYPRDVFNEGRVAWAKTFLKRDRIFLSSHFAHLEEKARTNLQNLTRL